MKRDNSVYQKAREIADNSTTMTDEERNAIHELICAYERATYKEDEDRHEWYRYIVDKMVNDMSFESKNLAKFMANNHPTLQQSYMRHCVDFINAMAEKTYTDARNEHSVGLAKELKKVADNYCLPMI